MFKALVTILNSKQSSTRSKSTLKRVLRTRNASVQDTLPTSGKEINEDEESPSDIIWQIVKEELAAHEKNIKALINSNLQTTNERLDKIATEMGELSKSLEFMQSQLDGELGSVKKDITKLENQIKSIENMQGERSRNSKEQLRFCNRSGN